MTSVSENAYIVKLDDKVKTYNSPYHKAIKMRAVDIKSGTYIDFNKKIIVGDHVRT